MNLVYHQSKSYSKILSLIQLTVFEKVMTDDKINALAVVCCI